MCYCYKNLVLRYLSLVLRDLSLVLCYLRMVLLLHQSLSKSGITLSSSKTAVTPLPLAWIAEP